MPSDQKLSSKLLKLPFEVYFSRLGIKTYQFLARHSPKSATDIPAAEISMGNSIGVTFRCENKTGAELLCTMGNDFVDVVPEWLEMIEEEQCEINNTELYSVDIDDYEISLIYNEMIDVSKLNNIGSVFSTYIFDENQDPDYLVLDADGERIKVSQGGCLIDDNGDEDEDQLIFDHDQLDDLLVQAANEAFQEKVDKSKAASNDQIKEEWINSQMNKFKGGKELKLSRDSE